MSDTKISDLTAITGANTAVDDDLVIVDTSAAQTKRITRDELKAAVLNTGPLTIGGAATLSDTLAVTGAAALSSSLVVAGATTLSDTLAAGATTVSGTLAAGATTVSGTLAASGATTLSDTLSVSGDATFSGAVTFSVPIDVSAESMDAIAETKAVTAVDVFVYDTSKDTDGGAWRDRTQATSWYNETLNTATRGARKEFPAVAVIVAEAAKVTIYDGDDPTMPMWMVFNASTSKMPYRAVNSLFALNGVISTTGGSTAGVSLISFVADDFKFIYPDGTYRYPNGAVGYRNTSQTFYNAGGAVIVSSSGNDVAMTVLPDAPIDPATGIQVPTIRVGTDGGISVIENDGTVTSTASSLYTESASSSPDYDLWYRHAFGRALLAGTSIYAYMVSSWYLKVTDTDGTAIDNWAIGDVSEGAPVYLKFTKIDFDPTGNKNHMTCGMTANYNSGWMPALVKGAFLSDTDDTDVTGGEYVANGTFASDTDWTKGTGWTISGGTLNISDETTSSAVYNSGGSVLDPSKSYIVTFTISASTANFGVQVRLSNSSGTYRYTPGIYYTADGTYSVTIRAGSFTAVDALMGFYRVGGHTGSLSIDNVSVKVADADRSVNNNGLVVNGTVTKTAVATGAELVAYSGFSASNYLEQPYNSDLDFGTGDFSIVFWATASASSDWMMVRQTAGTTNTSGFWLYQSGGSSLSGTLIYRSYEGGSSTQVTVGTLTNKLQHCAVIRKSGVTSTYMNGVFQNSVADTRNVSSTDAKLFVGCRADLSTPYLNGSLALLRISATAPTAAQITKIYNDERVLFQENAACTLYGSSDAVTALAHDDAAGLLHVGTSAGRSVFQGLRRVSNTTTAVGTAINASDGLVVEE